MVNNSNEKIQVVPYKDFEMGNNDGVGIYNRQWQCLHTCLLLYEPRTLTAGKHCFAHDCLYSQLG